MLNSVCLIGRLCRNCEVKTTTSGTQVLRNCIAINRTKEITDFINIVAFDKQAEMIEKYFVKGNLIAIQGSIQTNKFQKQDGTQGTNFEVLVRSIAFCDGNKKETTTNDNDFKFEEDKKETTTNGNKVEVETKENTNIDLNEILPF